MASIQIDTMTKNVIKIQSWFRGSIYRLHRLPIIMYTIQRYLRSVEFTFSQSSDDGRVNSSLDEQTCVDYLSQLLGNRIRLVSIRLWYDILVRDYVYGWIPINIKSSNMMSYDNVGNLTTCVYAYTNKTISLSKPYNNGAMSEILTKKLKHRRYNYVSKRDYYFIVLNKYNSSDIIVNSLKGLISIKSNINNLPFQVCWNKNREFKYEQIEKKIKLLINCFKQTRPSWKERFLKKIHRL